MTYDGDGETSARLVTPADQISRPGVGSIVVTGTATDGDYGLFRSELAPGSDIAAHFHRTFSEAFYVLRGTVQFSDGEAWRPAGTGSLFHIPKGGVHAVRNEADEVAEVLTLFVPGAPRERFVLELLELRTSGRELTSEEWTEFYARHDQYMV